MLPPAVPTVFHQLIRRITVSPLRADIKTSTEGFENKNQYEAPVVIYDVKRQFTRIRIRIYLGFIDFDKMRVFMIIALLTIVATINFVGAEEDKRPKVIPAEQFCSEILASDESYNELKGKEFVIRGIVSSIGDKRKAFLGNRINSVVDLIISPEIKIDPYGRKIETLSTCLISSQIKVPGEECEFRDGRYECRDITDPKLEDNKRTVLKLSEGEVITVRGILEGKSLLHQYALDNKKRQIVNISLSDSEIIEIQSGKSLR